MRNCRITWLIETFSNAQQIWMRNCGITWLLPRWIVIRQGTFKTTCLIPFMKLISSICHSMSSCGFNLTKLLNQLAMVLRYVKCGCPVERFIALWTRRIAQLWEFWNFAEYSSTVQHKGKISCASILWSSSKEPISQWLAGSDKTRISPCSFFALFRQPTQLGCHTNVFWYFSGPYIFR